MNCPTSAQLIDYLRGQLPAIEKDTIQLHLSAGCQRCQEERAWLAESLQLARTDQSFEFSEANIRQAVNLFKSQMTVPQASLGQLLGRLIFDSFRAQPLTATRGDLTMERSVSGRQMLYKAEGYDVDLRFERGDHSETDTLIGQILSEQSSTLSSSFTVRLICDREETASTTTNASGMFRFAYLPTGTYDLLIRVPEGEIQIRQISSGQNLES